MKMTLGNVRQMMASQQKPQGHPELDGDNMIAAKGKNGKIKRKHIPGRAANPKYHDHDADSY